MSSRRRSFKILRLFFGLVFSFFGQFVSARLRGHTYDFFEDSRRNRRRAIKIRESALELGGVLIKVGQFLSSRVDLLPSEYIEELALLQDEVPGVPFAAIRMVVESDLGQPLETAFAEFQSVPVAAASLGQVHRARLRSGQDVAVKVQRPQIREIVHADLATLRYIVRWIDRHTTLGTRADLPQILLEFEDTLRLELDYEREGHHAERLAIAFQDNPQIVIPRVFWSHTTGRVLTLEYMSGIKVTDFAEMEELGISRMAVAEVLMRAYLQQVLSEGFFHADPHPGNFFVQTGPRVILLDFGMVGQILPQTRNNIRHVFLGIIRRDYDEVILALQRLGFFTHSADIRAIKRALSWAVDNFYEVSFGELRAIDPRQVLDHLQDVLFHESFHIPANYAFLGRALGTLSGVCTALDPSFQFVTVAEPYARELIGERHGVLGTLNFLGAEARAVASNTYRMQFLARHVLEDLQEADVNFRREFRQVVHSVNRLELAMHRLLGAIFFLGFLLAGALIYRTQYTVLAVVASLLALMFLLRVLLPFGRRRLS